jgi:hypothetical protein
VQVAIDKPWRNNALINRNCFMLLTNLVLDVLLRAGGNDAAICNGEGFDPVIIGNAGPNLSGVYGCLRHLLFLCLPHAVDDLAGGGHAFF